MAKKRIIKSYVNVANRSLTRELDYKKLYKKLEQMSEADIDARIGEIDTELQQMANDALELLEKAAVDENNADYRQEQKELGKYSSKLKRENKVLKAVPDVKDKIKKVAEYEVKMTEIKEARLKSAKTKVEDAEAIARAMDEELSIAQEKAEIAEQEAEEAEASAAEAERMENAAEQQAAYMEQAAEYAERAGEEAEEKKKASEKIEEKIKLLNDQMDTFESIPNIQQAMRNEIADLQAERTQLGREEDWESAIKYVEIAKQNAIDAREATDRDTEAAEKAREDATKARTTADQAKTDLAGAHAETAKAHQELANVKKEVIEIETRK